MTVEQMVGEFDELIDEYLNEPSSSSSSSIGNMATAARPSPSLKTEL